VASPSECSGMGALLLALGGLSDGATGNMPP
jgi:hypothetical protein